MLNIFGSHELEAAQPILNSWQLESQLPTSNE